MLAHSTHLIVNFGGPRDISEIRSFLTALLTDRDVIRTNLPPFLQTILFRRVAKKRSKKIAHDYELIGKKSPIFQDTEELAKATSEYLGKEVLTFHRYLPATHADFIKKIESMPQTEITVFPMFPQFSYATTGSIARWFHDHLSEKTAQKLRWIKSYPAHPEFIGCYRETLGMFLEQNALRAEETSLLFSAHGIPVKFVHAGDIYEQECNLSFNALMKDFPGYKGRLAYQSKFGRGEWLRPYTDESCQEVLSWNGGRKNIVFVPITFTSDHIETLFEVEYQYLPMIRQKGLHAYRCPALGLQRAWIEAIVSMIHSSKFVTNDVLVRP